MNENLPMRRALVIGFDGLDPDVMDAMVQTGKLPHFQRLIESGHYTRILSTIPVNSAPAWASILTGVDPGRHGILDFSKSHFQLSDDSYQMVKSSDIGVRNIIDLFSARGKVVSVNVPLTYPPWKVNGYMVSGFPVPSAQVDYTYPLELKEDLSRLDYRIVNSEISRELMTTRPEKVSELYLSAAESVFRASCFLLNKVNDWNLFFVVFDEPDRFQHFWLDTKPGNEKIQDMYIRLDHYLGELVKFADPDTLILVLSDHGAMPLKICFAPNAWFTLNGLGDKSLLRLFKDTLVTAITANRYARNAARLVPLALLKQTTSTRPNQPVVATSLGYVKIFDSSVKREEVRRVLDLSTKLRFHGEAVIKSIHESSQLYSPNPNNPDFIIEPYPGVGLTHRTTLPLLFKNKQAAVADHQRDGVLIAKSSPEFSWVGGVPASVCDVTPSLLHCVFGARDRSMSGRTLFTSKDVPVILNEGNSVERGVQLGYDVSEEESLIEHLRSLGYT